MDVIHFTQGATDPPHKFRATGAYFVPRVDGEGDAHISCLHLEQGGRITAPSITHTAANCRADVAERRTSDNGGRMSIRATFHDLARRPEQIVFYGPL